MTDHDQLSDPDGSLLFNLIILLSKNKYNASDRVLLGWSHGYMDFVSIEKQGPCETLNFPWEFVPFDRPAFLKSIRGGER